MGVKTITELTELTSLSDDDLFLVYDTSTSASKKILKSTIEALPMGWIYGLGLSNYSGDTEHGITIAPGKARNDTDTTNMYLPSAMSKYADTEWGAGNDNGGMASGESLPTSGTIHVWLIKNPTTNTVDVMFNNNATTGLSPTLPEGYTVKRRIGSYRTDASANILNGDWWGTGNNRTFMYDTPILDVNATNPGTNAVTASLSVPGGVSVIARVALGGVAGDSGENPATYISALDNEDLAPSQTASPLASMGAVAVQGYAFQAAVKTNTSSQIRYRCKASAAAMKMLIATLGWEDSL